MKRMHKMWVIALCVAFISIAMAQVGTSGNTGATQRGTGDTHNGMYIEDSLADSAVVARRDNASASATNEVTTTNTQANTDNSEAVTTNTAQDIPEGTEPCSSCKWSWLGLLGLLGLAGLYRRRASPA